VGLARWLPLPYESEDGNQVMNLGLPLLIIIREFLPKMCERYSLTKISWCIKGGFFQTEVATV